MRQRCLSGFTTFAVLGHVVVTGIIIGAIVAASSNRHQG